jgi:hypothetical protein
MGLELPRTLSDSNEHEGSRLDAGLSQLGMRGGFSYICSDRGQKTARGHQSPAILSGNTVPPPPAERQGRYGS